MWDHKQEALDLAGEINRILDRQRQVKKEVIQGREHIVKEWRSLEDHDYSAKK